MGYKFRYRQNVQQQGGSSVSQEYTIDTETNVWELNPFNTAWGNAGCYAGATPANGSEIGSYSIASWSGWNKDTVYSDMRDLYIRSYSGSSQQNLRFIAKYGSASFTVNKQSFNWTNLREPTVRVVSDAIENLTNYSEYDPYRRDNKNVSASGSNNSPLNIAPLESLKINQLIFVPIFHIKEVEYYDYDDVAEGYANVLIPSTTTNYTWADIKPEDKSPAGENYDADLFEKGWTEITPTKEGGRRFRFCCGVTLTPYYGNCSNIYNPTTDTYTAGINPDDGNVYGDRQVFGSVQSQADEYPVIGNTTNMSRPCLMVMTESYDSVTGGLVYSLPAGISFANLVATGSVSGNVHALSSSWSLASDFHKFAATTSWTSEFFSGNQIYCNFYADVDPANSNTQPDLSITSTVIDTEVNISSLYNITDLTTANRIYLPNNNPIAFYFQKGNRNVTATNVAFYSINALWHTIASLGCYVADSTTTAQKAQTGYNIGENNHLYLGHMGNNGITDGIMLQGKEIKDSTQAKIDDIIQNTPYTPVIPTPGGGGGGTDPSNPPTPSGKGEPKITGDSTTGHKPRYFGGGSVRYYALNASEMDNFRNILWSQPNSFFERLNIAGKNNTSIFDYISSVRYYPTDLATLTTIGEKAPVYLGSGAKFTEPDGSDYKLNTLSGFFGDTIWCHWNMASFPGWRNNFLDYSPYSKLSIYLPYAGTFDLDIQTCASMTDITSVTIYVRVCVDLNTGSMTYFVDADGILILEHTCKIGVDISLTGNDSIRQAVGILDTNYKSAQRLLGDGVNFVNSVLNKDALSAGTNILSSGLHIADSYIQNSLAQRQIPTAVGGFGGTMSTITQGQNPYLTLYRQKIANPENYGHSIGYLTCSTHTVSSLKGFTVCENVDVTSIPATSAEQEMIKNIMESGFYA